MRSRLAAVNRASLVWFEDPFGVHFYGLRRGMDATRRCKLPAVVCSGQIGVHGD